MARKPMVTRTIKTTTVNVLCLDIVNGEPFNESVTLPRTYENEKAMLKAVSAIIDNEERKAVHIVGHTVDETLYGMSEQDFIEHAEKLPPRQVKEVDGETDTETDTETN